VSIAGENAMAVTLTGVSADLLYGFGRFNL
jgi:hypothetical protein